MYLGRNPEFNVRTVCDTVSQESITRAVVRLEEREITVWIATRKAGTNVSNVVCAMRGTPRRLQLGVKIEPKKNRKKKKHHSDSLEIHVHAVHVERHEQEGGPGISSTAPGIYVPPRAGGRTPSTVMVACVGNDVVSVESNALTPIVRGLPKSRGP